MSRIDQLGDNLENLPSIINEYQEALEQAESHLSIKGKNLEKANIEQPSWHSYYDQLRIELHSILKFVESKMNSTRGRLFRSYTENYGRDLSDRAKDKYIDNEQAFLDMYELYLEIKEMYDKYQSVVDAFQARGYALNNITKLRVSALEDVMV